MFSSYFLPPKDNFLVPGIGKKEEKINTYDQQVCEFSTPNSGQDSLVISLTQDCSHWQRNKTQTHVGVAVGSGDFSS